MERFGDVVICTLEYGRGVDFVNRLDERPLTRHLEVGQPNTKELVFFLSASLPFPIAIVHKKILTSVYIQVICSY